LDCILIISDRVSNCALLSVSTDIIYETNLYSCSGCFRFKSLHRHWKSSNYRSSLKASNQFVRKFNLLLNTKYYLIKILPTIWYCWIWYCVVKLRNIYPHHIKNSKHLCLKNFPYTISFIYVTFTAKWNGQAYVIAVDYNRYIILKIRSFDLGTCKHVYLKMNYLILTIGFFMAFLISIFPSVLPPASNNLSQNRIIKIFDITHIFQNLWKN